MLHFDVAAWIAFSIEAMVVIVGRSVWGLQSVATNLWSLRLKYVYFDVFGQSFMLLYHWMYSTSILDVSKRGQ